MNGPAQRAFDFLSGRPATPPVCLQTYLALYLEPQRRAGRAAVYRELLGGEAERAVQEQWEAAGPLLATSCGSPLTLDTPAWKLDALVAATDLTPSAR